MQVKYKSAAEKARSTEFTPMETTPEMKLSKELKPIISRSQYQEDAKKLHKDVYLGAGTNL